MTQFSRIVLLLFYRCFFFFFFTADLLTEKQSLVDLQCTYVVSSSLLGQRILPELRACLMARFLLCRSVQPDVLRRRGADVRRGDPPAARGSAALRVPPQLHGGRRRVRRPGAGVYQQPSISHATAQQLPACTSEGSVCVQQGRNRLHHLAKRRVSPSGIQW